MGTFSFSPPINIAEESEWLSALTSFETTNSAFIITNENKSFSIATPGYWSLRGSAETIKELREIVGPTAQSHIGLHVEDVKKRGNQTKIGHKEYKLSDFDTRRNEMIEELQNAEYDDLEDMVFRLELTNSENEDTLDMKYIHASSGYTLALSIDKISEKI